MWIEMRSKYKARCRRCYKPIKVGQLIEWHKEKKTARHKGCKKGSVMTFGGKARKVT